MIQIRLPLLSLITLLFITVSCSEESGPTNASASNETVSEEPVKQGNKWRFNPEITFELRSVENSIINFNDLQKKAINEEPYHAFADILDQHASKIESMLQGQNEADNSLASELQKLKSISQELHNSKDLHAKETFNHLNEWIHHLHSQFEFDYN
ncbi:MAG: hypothetical protein K1X81_02635 [Bacteroidia bacterium]|nr:hypothetical protein [Bacteroidia bacterium]